MNTNNLRAGLKIERGTVFWQKAGWRGDAENNLQKSLGWEHQDPALCQKTLWAAGLLPLSFVGAGVTAPCGDAPPSPPRSKPKSLAAAPLSIFRQALIARTLLLATALLISGRVSAFGLEPQTLFNFQVSPGMVFGNLVEGPDGNFYGTTSHGGPRGNGTIFRVTPSGNLTTIISDQANPAAGLAVGNDGLLYGLTGAGGPFGWGTAFRMTTSAVLTNFAVLDGMNGGNPQFGPVLAGDGNFYGVSAEGGANSLGAIFRITPGGAVTLLNSFTFDTNGASPVAGLTVGPDGQLYGLTTSGGSIGAGTVFKISQQGVLTTLHSFQNGDGFVHQAPLTLGPDGNLYGTARDGGSADMGAIFKITTNGTFTIMASFAGTNGAVPMGQLAVGADGQLYGTTELGGAATLGTVFKMATNGVLTTLASFTSSGNSLPVSGLLLARDGNFYGCSQGAVFKVTPNGVMRTVASLIPLDGINPQSALTLGPDGNFYGTTRAGGTNSLGTIFRLSLDGVFTRMLSFDGTNGSFPEVGLTLGKDGNFYGATTAGGSNRFYGTVFRFTTNRTLTTLVSFDGANSGSDVQSPLLMDTNGVLYGSTPLQGPGLRGTVFRIATNGVLTTLVSFNTTNGATPRDGVIMGDDGNFYGTTTGGGVGNAGTIFRLTPAGAFTTLFSFSNTNGANPIGGLVWGKDGYFYGTTGFGGTNLGFGTVFKISTNGTLTTLYNFHGTDGEEPSFRLIFGNDGRLYGTTSFGGSTANDPFGTGAGSVFSIATNGAYATLLLFQGTNGSNPAASLVLGPDGNLYGTTPQGGPGGGGTIFRVILAPQFAGIARLLDHRFVLTATAPPLTPFRLLSAQDLATPLQSWTVLASGVFDMNGTAIYTNSSPVPDHNYYRLVEP